MCNLNGHIGVGRVQCGMGGPQLLVVLMAGRDWTSACAALTKDCD